MYEEWTTEVPQYNDENLIAHGGSAPDLSSLNLASSRSGISFATLGTDWYVGFRLVFGVIDYN